MPPASSSSTAATVDRRTPAPAVITAPGVDRTRSITPTFLVTVGLLALAAYAIAKGVNEALGGAIVGYIAAFWLPAVRVDPSSGGPRQS